MSEVGGGWTRHMSRSQNKPYLYHHKRNERIWTEEGLSEGWGFVWEKNVKTYVNVLTNHRTTKRPLGNTQASAPASQLAAMSAHPPVAAAAAAATTTSDRASVHHRNNPPSIVESATSHTKASSEPALELSGAETGNTAGNQQHVKTEEADVASSSAPDPNVDYEVETTAPPEPRNFNPEDLEEEHQKQRGNMTKNEISNLLGYPENKPLVQGHPHGWCFKPQQSALKQVLSSETGCVVELGSYLGNASRVICKAAPYAQVYCVDLWDFNYICKTQREQYQQYELEIMSKHDLYETFLVNTWDSQLRCVDEENGTFAGITPMRMHTVEALRYLYEGGAYPDVIYIDGDHSKEGVLQDLEAALHYFPGSKIMGNDYRNKTVQESVDSVAQKYRIDIFADAFSMIWTLGHPLKEADYNTTNCIEDVHNETVSRYYRVLKGMISRPAPVSEIQYALLNNLKILRGYMNHCSKKNKGRTLLMHAAAEGRVDCVKALMKSFNADPHVKGYNNDYTALHHAAYNGKGRCVEVLLLAGAKCSALNKYNETPEASARSRGYDRLANAIQKWLQDHPENETDGSGNSGLSMKNKRRGRGLSMKYSSESNTSIGTKPASDSADASEKSRSKRRRDTYEEAEVTQESTDRKRGKKESGEEVEEN